MEVLVQHGWDAFLDPADVAKRMLYLQILHNVLNAGFTLVSGYIIDELGFHQVILKYNSVNCLFSFNHFFITDNSRSPVLPI